MDVRAIAAVALGLTAAAAPVQGAVIFSQFTIDEVATQSALEAAAQASGTSGIAGIAAEPGATGDVFAIHADSAQAESFLRVDPDGGVPVRLTGAATIGQQLGAPYGAGIELKGGFAYSPPADELYFGEDFYGSGAETSVIALNAKTGAARLVTRSADLSELSDLTVMPGGTIAVARSAPASAAGTVHPQTGVYETKITEAALLAASPGSTSLPPEAIAADPVAGKTYIAAHSANGLFEVDDIGAASPVVSRLAPPEMAGTDVHDLAVDQYGNVYGLDSAGDRIVIIRSTDGMVFTFPLSQIALALGRPAFSAVPWRGLAARISGYAQADLFLSSGTNSYGIIRVRFGSVESGVKDWTLY